MTPDTLPKHGFFHLPKAYNRGILGVALFWWLSILLLLPFGRSIVNYFREKSLLVFSITVMLAVFYLLVVGLVSYLRKRNYLTFRGGLILCAGVGLIVLLAQLMPRSEERVHIVQYGVLGVMLWWAPKMPAYQHIWWISLVGALTGWLDEVIQWLLPERMYGWSDVLLNAVSTILGAIIMAISYRHFQPKPLGKKRV